MKKFLTIVLSFVTLLICCSCTKDPLPLKSYTWTSCIEHGRDYKSFVDMSEEELNSLEISAVSKDESIAWIEGESIKTGNKLGKTQVEISTSDKVAILEVEVVSVISYLAKEVSSADDWLYPDYLACSWLIKNIEDFKNPSSVEVLEAYPHYKNGEIDYFIMKTRAQTSFGGNTIDYTLVEYKGISDGFSPFIFEHMLMDGFKRMVSFYFIERALKEYKAGIHY